MPKIVHAKDEKVRSLIPLDGLNSSRQPPLKRIEVLTEVTQLIMISISLLKMLARCNVSLIKLHSNLS